MRKISGNKQVASAPVTGFNQEGMHLDTLCYAFYVLCRMKDIRPDQRAHFGRELGLSAEEIQREWNWANSWLADWPEDEPLPIRVVKLPERKAE